MRPRHLQRFTFENHLQDVWYNNEQTDQELIRETFSKFNSMNVINYPGIPAFFILDYSRKNYSLVGKGISGIAKYHPQVFLEGGWDMTRSIYNSDDFCVFNKFVFPRNLDLLTSIPAEEHLNHIFSHSWRIANRDGSTSTVIQRNVYITSPITGKPIYSLGVLIDISHFRRPGNYVTHFVEKVDRTSQSRKLIISDFYPSSSEFLRLTKKEIEILHYLADGKSSKMIADKLRISISTANNHRQNILHKTNTSNIAQLVAFAVKNGII